MIRKFTDFTDLHRNLEFTQETPETKHNLQPVFMHMVKK